MTCRRGAWCSTTFGNGARMSPGSTSEGTKGLLLPLKRWIKEQSFAWFGCYRRLSKDYEYLTHASEAMIRVAMINLIVRRLARVVPS